MPVFLLLLIAVGILWPVRLHVRAYTALGGVRISLCLRLFFCMVPVSRALQLQWQRLNGFCWYRIRPDGSTQRLANKRKHRQGDLSLLHFFFKMSKLTSFQTNILIGNPQDACGLVLACGAISTMLNTVLCILFDHCKNKRISVWPAFDQHAFRLDLEGIFWVNSAKIMIAVIKRKISLRGAKNNDASHRKHHEEFYGTD